MEWNVNPDWNKPLQLELTSDWLTAKFPLWICWVKACGSKGEFGIRWRVFYFHTSFHYCCLKPINSKICTCNSKWTACRLFYQYECHQRQSFAFCFMYTVGWLHWMWLLIIDINYYLSLYWLFMFIKLFPEHKCLTKITFSLTHFDCATCKYSMIL